MAAAALPPPLVTDPALDLSAYSWFPLDTRRLARSNFWRMATNEVRGISVTLWAEAWTQVPAASLPNDDRQLAAMARMSLAEWRKIRREVMGAWVLCENGRLYHPTLAEVAMEKAQIRVRWKKAKQRIRKKKNMRPRVSRETGDDLSLSSPSLSAESESPQGQPGRESDEVKKAPLTVIEGGKE